MLVGGRSKIGPLLAAGGVLYLAILLVLQLTSNPQDVLHQSSYDPTLTDQTLNPKLLLLRRPLDLKDIHGSDKRNSDQLNHSELEVTLIQGKKGKHKLILQDMPLENRKKVPDDPYNLRNEQNLVPPRYGLIINQPYLCHKVDSDDIPNQRTLDRNTLYVPVYLLIIVHSHPVHRRRRDAIRETWGKISHSNDVSMHTVLLFLLGMPEDYTEYLRLQREARLYRDMIVYDFLDTYRNLTIKSLLGLFWSSIYCNNTMYILKADDDVYLNVHSILNVLKGAKTQNLILGSRNVRSTVRRYGQWKVSYRDYPHPFFPPYCSGCTYILSSDMAGKLYHMSQSSQSPAFISIEDVYITGLLAERLGVNCIHHERFPSWVTVPTLPHIKKYLQGEVFGLHGMEWIHMHGLHEMIRRCTNCTTDLDQAKQWFTWLMDQDTMYG